MTQGSKSSDDIPVTPDGPVDETDGRPPHAPHRDSNGDQVRRIGHYEIVHEIGRGGMGIVYKARDLVLHRDVALKTPITSGHLNPRQRRRFLREARAASQLSHPGIVTVYEVFEHDESPWIAMEYVDGDSLAAVISSGNRLPVQQVLEFQETLAGALHAAHSKGVLHRDIKPSNILIGCDGRARIGDFGLARRLFFSDSEIQSGSHNTKTLTMDGAVLGTLAYMSPEQVLGRQLDQRSDIYSLGVVFYEMCTGTRLFAGSGDGEIIDSVLHHTPEPASTSNDEIPPDLDRIIQRCLDKRPERRFTSAGELCSNLQVLRRRSETAGGIQPLLQKPWHTRQFLKWAASTIAAMAAAILVVVLLQRMIPGEGLPPMTPRQVSDHRGLGPEISPTGTEIVYSAADGATSDIWVIDVRGGNSLRLTSHPADDTDPTWFPDGSAVAFVSSREGRESIWKVPRFGGNPVLLVPNASDPAVSRDGEMIAFTRRGVEGFQRVAVAPLVDTSNVRVLTADPDGLWDHRNPAWSPDGDFLSYHSFRNLWLLDIANDSARALTQDDGADANPVWSPDGRHIYFDSYRGGARAIWQLTVAGGQLDRVTMGTGPERSPSLSLDGRSMAYSTDSETTSVVFMDVLSGERSRLHESRLVSEPAIAPDRSSVVFVSTRGNSVDLWRVPIRDNGPDGDPIRMTEHEGSCAHPVYSPDGRWIAYHRVVNGERDVWVIPAEGGMPQRFTDHPAMDVLPEWSPAGSEIAFSSDRGGSLQIWIAPFEDGQSVGDPAQVTDASGTALYPSWSPDGSHLAYLLVTDSAAEIWLMALDGKQPPRQVTTGADARVVTWNRQSGNLLVLGFWGEPEPSIRSVAPETGFATSIEDFHPANSATIIRSFDLSSDGGLLVLNEVERTGSLWVLETEAGSF